MVSHPVQGLHRKAALTTIYQPFNFGTVDDRKGLAQIKFSHSEVDWVISSVGQLAGRPNLKKPTALRGVVGVWNCESSDYIRGRDGACFHAVGFLVRSERLEHNQCHGLFLSFLKSSSLHWPSSSVMNECDPHHVQ